MQKGSITVRIRLSAGVPLSPTRANTTASNIGPNSALGVVLPYLQQGVVGLNVPTVTALANWPAPTVLRQAGLGSGGVTIGTPRGGLFDPVASQASLLASAIGFGVERRSTATPIVAEMDLTQVALASMNDQQILSGFASSNDFESAIVPSNTLVTVNGVGQESIAQNAVVSTTPGFRYSQLTQTTLENLNLPFTNAHLGIGSLPLPNMQPAAYDYAQTGWASAVPGDLFFTWNKAAFNFLVTLSVDPKFLTNVRNALNDLYIIIPIKITQTRAIPDPSGTFGSYCGPTLASAGAWGSWNGDYATFIVPLTYLQTQSYTNTTSLNLSSVVPGEVALRQSLVRDPAGAGPYAETQINAEVYASRRPIELGAFLEPDPSGVTLPLVGPF